MNLTIVTEVRVPTGTRPLLRKVLKKLCQTHQVQSDICIILASDNRLRALKLEFWGEDANTDVLTFPQWEPGDPFMPPVLGDIFISLETAQKQAIAHQHSLETEIIVLASHGLTHLLGFDHTTELEWQPFHDMEALARAAMV